MHALPLPLLVACDTATPQPCQSKHADCSIPVARHKAVAHVLAGTGWDAIQEQVKKLEKKHALHIAGYGEGNERRLTGKHETSSMESFRYAGTVGTGCWRHWPATLSLGYECRHH